MIMRGSRNIQKSARNIMEVGPARGGPTSWERNMGGHSHWAGIKHKKAVVDAKRGKLFTKIIKEITISARLKGGDPDSNPRLRTAIDAAKNANMPQENIKKAIMRGTGQIPGVRYEDITYEGYGPAGTAVIVEVTTDNKNRTYSEIRKIFEKHGGNIGTAGSTAWMFEKKGYIVTADRSLDENKFMNLAIEAGAEDFKPLPDAYALITSPENFDSVREKLAAGKVNVETAEITMLPKTEVKIPKEKAKRVIDMMNALEDHDDVKTVYSNFDIPDEILAELDD